MAQIIFNPTAFRALFPAFADPTKYPDATMLAYADQASAYISDQTGGCCCSGMSLKQQTLALNQMTAHLLFLSGIVAGGETPGVLTGATIDKVSVQFEAPPSSNNWKFWLNQSPYGQALLALLLLAGVGGTYIPGGNIPAQAGFQGGPFAGGRFGRRW